MNTKVRAPHLLDEPPILVYPSLAVALGNVNEAIILQQLHFLMNSAKTSKNTYVFIDGHWWVYNSYEQWREHFPWLAVVTIKGLFTDLERRGIVVSRQGVKDKRDRRKWYTINYDAYGEFISCNGQNLSDDEIKNIPSNGQNLSNDSSETPTETPTESKSLAPVGAGTVAPPEDLPQGKGKTPKDTTAGQAVNAIIAAWLATGGARGSEIIQPNAYKNRTIREAAKVLHDRGITSEVVTAYLKSKHQDRFWHDKAVPWNALLGEIVGYHERTRPQWQPAPDEPDPYAHLTTPLRVPGKRGA